MKKIETSIPDLYILEPKVFGDHRGYFMESYNKNTMKDLGINIDFIQDNQSFSSKGVLRGLHYQLNPQAQTKLIRVLQGSIVDVVVDIRKNSPTFGKYEMLELSSENQRQLLVPQGFAHGFVVKSDEALVFYKCDNFYSPENERSIRYNCPEIGIDWSKFDFEFKLSEKDINGVKLSEADNNFIYE